MQAEARKIRIVADAEAVAVEAARRLIARLRASKHPSVCLTGGSSPRRLYELLGSEPWRCDIDWQATDWFMGDERFVPSDNPLNNMAMARKIRLDRLAPAETVHG